MLADTEALNEADIDELTEADTLDDEEPALGLAETLDDILEEILDETESEIDELILGDDDTDEETLDETDELTDDETLEETDVPPPKLPPSKSSPRVVV